MKQRKHAANFNRIQKQQEDKSAGFTAENRKFNKSVDLQTAVTFDTDYIHPDAKTSMSDKIFTDWTLRCGG